MTKIFLTAIFFVIVSPLAWSACFDFKEAVTKPLRENITLTPSKDNQELGKTSAGVSWAQLRGQVAKDIDTVIALLLDHNTTKSDDVDEFKVHEIKKTAFDLARHEIEFLVRHLMIKIRWKETWAYAVTEGTLKDPQKIVISYEKTDGTSHIKHLCGSMVVRKLGPKSIDIDQYEEVVATGRSAQDTLKSLKSVLQTIRN